MNYDDQHPYATSLVRIKKKYRGVGCKRPTIPSLFLNRSSSENVLKQFENLNDGNNDENIDRNCDINDINNSSLNENEHDVEIFFDYGNTNSNDTKVQNNNNNSPNKFTVFEKTTAWIAQQQKFFNRLLKGNFSFNSASTDININTKNSSDPNLKQDSLDIESCSDDQVLIAVCECGNASLYQTVTRRRDADKERESSAYISISTIEKQPRQKKSILEPEIATSVHKVVPQLVLYWETVGLVGTCIARRCAGWRS
ncbi:9883_t:CDS:1 [Ambispora gerdemannii]|uniref:9883_t:CDS:1 n=1 Tax=Ambispora gerdemannii TaxID=144530 RepID=A0A9N8WF62_9GLOM|nr:9883_t:CDS:1 [Ambispora gerdemannii]